MDIDEKSKVILDIVRPFGPSILKTKLTEELIKDLNKDCLDIIEKKKEKIDWSNQLAGRVEEEFHISQDTLLKHASWFNAVTGRYLFPSDEDYKAQKDNFKVGIASGWYVRSFGGDFNPYHYHTGCNISCIGYLKMPEDINEYWETEDKDHNPFGGYLDFRYGTIGLNCPNNLKLKPQVGDFYMFPNYLDHCVYPFKSKYNYPDVKGERRSFSLNLVFSNVEKDRNKS